MPTFTSLLVFAVFLGTLNSTLSLAHARYRNNNNNNRPGQIHIFNDVGGVQIEDSGKRYVLRGGQIFLEESYGDSDSRLTTLIPISNETCCFLDDTTGRTTSHTTSSSATRYDNVTNFLEDMQVLSLETLRLHNISSRTFGWIAKVNLQFLIMRHTDIKIVANDTLRSTQSTLQILDLSYAKISMKDLEALMRGLYNDETKDRSSNLSVLSLANLGLRMIPYKALSLVGDSLQALSLFRNNFQIIGVKVEVENHEVDSAPEAPRNYYSNLLQKPDTSTRHVSSIFPRMPFLNELDLRQCNISYIQPGTFKNLSNLKQLYISQNNIFILPDFMFEGLTNLIFLDISFNRHSNEYYMGMKLKSNSFADLYSLQTLNLSYSIIFDGSIKFLSGVPPSLTILELRASGLSTLLNGTFAELSNLQVLNLSHNIKLGPELTSSIFVGLSMLQELYMVRTSLDSLNPLEDLSALRLLDVSNNSIATFERLLEKFPLLEYLDISCNYIQSWKDERVFTGNSRLKSVYLHSNIITWMSVNMLEDFKSLSSLTLRNNNFICNCNFKNLMEYLMDKNNDTIENLPLLTDYKSNNATYVCTDAALSTIVDLSDTDSLCADSSAYWLSALQHGVYISMLTTVCLLGLGGLIYWKWYDSLVDHKWYIRYVAVLLKNATVMSMINVKNCEDRIYTYDLFVSYADANRNWVIEELIPNIEGPEGRLNICLHERDFQVGVSILENIMMGMDQSRTILLIISGCFIKSQWCQFEMHLAQHRLLETCREELVLVLLEEIPRRKRPKTLHYLMMVKTYIVYPKETDNVSAKKLFWKRLRRAITVNKSKRSTVV